MLNTATWTTSIGNSTALQMNDLSEDFDETSVFDTIPVTGLSRTARPEKPYVYGRNFSAAELLREKWNRMNPHNPMP